MKVQSFKLKAHHFSFPDLTFIHNDPSITRLEVIDGSYSELHPSLFECHHLTHIDIKGSKLEILPAKIFQLKSLTTLKIHHGELTTIEPPLKINKNLEVLFLNQNKIRSLPRELSYLIKLQRINFDHNQILEFAPELGAFEELRHLSIEMNPLSDEARSNIKQFYQIDL